MSANVQPQAGQLAQKPPLTFEFTKRKRWADLLITELADGIILILSATCKVLYCGTAVTELIGWRDIDLIDRDLVDFIAFDDQVAFRTHFDESVQTNTELLSYIRLNINDAMPSYSASYKDVLMEVKGRPHFVSEHDIECKCVFAVAKPYLTRNMTMLNTYLELKTEHEQLQQRVTELRNLAPAQSFPTPSAVVSQPNPMYATSSMHSQRVLSGPVVASQPSGSYYPNMSINPSGFDENLPIASAGTSYDGGLYGTRNAYASSSTLPLGVDDDAEEASKRKKLKKTHLAEQYVCITCGRTDSPEWRKGPLGPKTLCNACGLRWAKQMRKYDDPVEGGGESSVP